MTRSAISAGVMVGALLWAAVDAQSVGLSVQASDAVTNEDDTTGDAVGIDPRSGERRIHIELDHPRTNPHTGYTVIPFFLSHGAEVAIRAHTPAGRQVGELVNRYLFRGRHKLFVRSEDIGAAVLVLTMRVDNQSRVMTMIAW